MQKVVIVAEVVVDTDNDYEAKAAAMAAVQGYPSTVTIDTQTGSRGFLGRKEINILHTRVDCV